MVLYLIIMFRGRILLHGMFKIIVKFSTYPRRYLHFRENLT